MSENDGYNGPSAESLWSSEELRECLAQIEAAAAAALLLRPREQQVVAFALRDAAKAVQTWPTTMTLLRKSGVMRDQTELDDIALHVRGLSPHEEAAQLADRLHQTRDARGRWSRGTGAA